MLRNSNVVNVTGPENRDFAAEAATRDCELSIAVCTHNRPQGVEEIIGILQPQIAGHAVELIVVDSASNAEAAAQLREMTAAAPQTRLIRLDVAGVSVARNAGLQAAKAAWIAYIDDDEILPADWIFQIGQLAARLPPECAACGGNVLPVFPAGMERKLSWRWLDYLSMVNQEGEFDQTAAPKFPSGHCLVRAQILRDIGGFDTRLGRDGNALLSGEEVLLVKQLAERGWKIWHSSRIAAGHKISVERLTRHWVRKRAFWEGVTTVKILAIQSPGEIRRLAFQAAAKKPVLAAAATIFGDFRDADLRLAFLQGTEAARLYMTESIRPPGTGI